MKRTILGVGLGTAVLLVVACGSKTSQPAASAAPAAPIAAVAAAPTVSYPGQYIGRGGGGAIGEMQVLTDAFKKQHPEMTWNFQDVGSDASVGLVTSNTVDLGFISRDPTADETAKVMNVPIGAVGTGLMVNASNPVRNLTSDQVRAIFSGQITDWAAVGGTPGKIRLLLREKVAATRTNFESYFFNGKVTYPADAIEFTDVNEMLNSIQSFSGAIGMVTIDNQALTTSVAHLVAIDNVSPTKATLLSGAYQVRRPLYLQFNKDMTVLKPGVRAFIDFVRSPDGQKAIADLG